MNLSRQAFHELVQRALVDLPPQFQHYMQDLTVDVEDRPDAATVRALDLDDPRSL